MISVVPALAGSDLIRSQSAKPSISGISESVSTSAKGAPPARALSMAASAARPPLTAVGVMPQRASMSRTMRRLIA